MPCELNREAGCELTVMTEPELASLLLDERRRVVEHRGRYWTTQKGGFFTPVHALARLHADEVSLPRSWGWGYRAALTDGDASLANGSVPVHLLSDLDSYGEARLNRERRRNLRRCHEQVEIRRVEDPELLAQQGYDVFASAMKRVGYWKPLSPARYRERRLRRAADPRWMILAGLVDGRLSGYFEAYAVDGVMYTQDLHVATDAMLTGIATGLWFEMLMAAARSGQVREVCLGLHAPEVPTLGSVKAGLGSHVVRVPARTYIHPPIGAFLAARQPATYYRLTGSGPYSQDAATP